MSYQNESNLINTHHMKWWGWGDPQKEFIIHDKPNLWPYITQSCNLPNNVPLKLPVAFDEIVLPEPRINKSIIEQLNQVLQPRQIKLDKHERLIHCYGKSFRDLWRIRNGIIDSAPDAICYPESEDDVVAILSIASQHNIIVIPFGGGSNIAGCVEAIETANRAVITLDMREMNKVLAIDKKSLTARIQAGTMGPILEEQLNKAGVTLGHFPDSFEYSTLGGWVATRSAGMQSDKYGKIEDMVFSLRMVTPQGTIVTKTVPKASNGIDINHLCIGSEGILGVITEITMKVHRLPECKKFYGYLFSDFEQGVAAILECQRQNCMPIVTRLNDPDKTALSFAYKTKEKGIGNHLAKVIKLYLKYVKKLNFSKACLMLIAFEGDKKAVKQQRKKVNAIYKKWGAFSLGTKPGNSFEKSKYDFPYLRDYVMNYGIMADVSETSTTWNNLLPLYYKTREAIIQATLDTGSQSVCGCHISHTYHAGASLYFTFACSQKPGEELKQYDYIKKAAEDAFIKYGGCLSHHHAVGYEHRPWIQDDISALGVKAVQALKNNLDPQAIMNPGKIVKNTEIELV